MKTTEQKPMDVTVVQEKVNGMETMVAETKIQSEADLADVADKIKNIKTLGKFIRQEMERYTKPAMEIVRTAQEKFLPYEKACKIAEVALKSKAGIYMEQQEAKRKKEEDKIAKDLESGKIKKEETALRKMEAVGEEKKSVQTGATTLTRKMVKQAEITDPSQVPDEYWIIDEVRVKKAAIAGAVIPGVTVKEVPQMSVR